MEIFIASVHIKADCGREDFLRRFTDYVKGFGYDVCGEDDADVVYSFGFSDNGWVTVGSSLYCDGNLFAVRDDMEGISAAWGVPCMVVDNVVYQFALLTLYEGGTETARLFVGDIEKHGLTLRSNGEIENLAPLLSAGHTWEELINIAEKTDITIEEQLTEMAELFGLKRDKIMAEFADLGCGDPTNETICFCKAS